MLVRTRAIVLRATKYSETSLIVTAYTEALGIRKYMFNGVRSAKSKTGPSLLQPFSVIDLVAYYKENRDLHHVKETRPAYIAQRIPFEVARGTMSLFMTEVAYRVLKETEPNQALFDFLLENIAALDVLDDGLSNLHLRFLLRLSDFLGFSPNGEFSLSTPYFDMKEGLFVSEIPTHRYGIEPPLSEYFSLVNQCELTELNLLPLNTGSRRALLPKILDYYYYHIEGMPPIVSHEILQSIF